MSILSHFNEYGITLQDSKLFLAMESYVLHIFPKVDLSLRLRMNGLLPLSILIASLAEFRKCNLIVSLLKNFFLMFHFLFAWYVDRLYHTNAQGNLHIL